MQKNWKKSIILFLASQTVSLLGSSLVQYAITWYITLSTASGTMMTISIIVSFLPNLFLSPFAGVWADRYNRKMLIILSDSLIAISTLLIAVLFLLGYDSIWLLFAVSAIRALGQGIQTPAVSAILPQIVPEDKLTKVNATNQSIQSLVMLISPMLSGALLSLATLESIFFIDVITAAIAVVILAAFLNVPLHAKALQKEKVSYSKDLVDGIRYIRKHGFIKRFFLFSGLFFILSGPVAFLTPLQVTRSFGDDVWRLTAIEITFSVGMMLGGVFMAVWGGFKNRVHTIALSSFLMSACTIALGIIPIFWIYLGVMALFGAAMPAMHTPFTVLLQEKVEGDYLGRVFGVLGMISSSMMPLGMLFFGPLADAIEIEKILLGTGILMVLLCFYLIANKGLIEAGKPVVSSERK